MNAKLFSISLLTAGVLLATGSPASASGYKFTDLGLTLDSTHLGGYTRATGINDAGQVVGWSFSSYWGAERSMTVVHAIIWNGTTPTIFASESSRYGVGFYPRAINDSGHLSYTTALIWNGTTMTDLGTPRWGSANDINNSGQVAGSFVTSRGPTHAVIWDGTAPESAWQPAIDLGTLGGNTSVA
jgi:probable HAF family extracellular repeat protein